MGGVVGGSNLLSLTYRGEIIKSIIPNEKC
jgi:hypothetical protein